MRIRPVQRTTTVAARIELFRDAVTFVEANYAAELTLNQVARSVATSRRQLQRVYSEVGRTTFREHLAAVRMQRAAAMLADGQLTIRQISRLVGYRTPAQFAKAFRRHIGINPSEYRSHRRRPEPTATGPQPIAVAT